MHRARSGGNARVHDMQEEGERGKIESDACPEQCKKNKAKRNDLTKLGSGEDLSKGSFRSWYRIRERSRNMFQNKTRIMCETPSRDRIMPSLARKHFANSIGMALCVAQYGTPICTSRSVGASDCNVMREQTWSPQHHTKRVI